MLRPGKSRISEDANTAAQTRPVSRNRVLRTKSANSLPQTQQKQQKQQKQQPNKARKVTFPSNNELADFFRQSKEKERETGSLGLGAVPKLSFNELEDNAEMDFSPVKHVTANNLMEKPFKSLKDKMDNVNANVHANEDNYQMLKLTTDRRSPQVIRTRKSIKVDQDLQDPELTFEYKTQHHYDIEKKMGLDVASDDSVELTVEECEWGDADADGDAGIFDLKRKSILSVLHDNEPPSQLADDEFEIEFTAQFDKDAKFKNEAPLGHEPMSKDLLEGIWYSNEKTRAAADKFKDPLGLDLSGVGLGSGLATVDVLDTSKEFVDVDALDLELEFSDDEIELGKLNKISKFYSSV